MTFGENLWKHVVMKDSDTKQIMIFMTKSKKSQVCIFLKLRICTVASWTILLWDYVSELHRRIHQPKTGIEPTRWEAKWMRVGDITPRPMEPPIEYIFIHAFIPFASHLGVLSCQMLHLFGNCYLLIVLPAVKLYSRTHTFCFSHERTQCRKPTSTSADVSGGGLVGSNPVKGTLDCFRNINFEMRSILPWYFNRMI